ncbi:hypothetical protein [Devosia sp. DBB001]|nr:hypothetical protein [Devosia sp. DBB001]
MVGRPDSTYAGRRMAALARMLNPDSRTAAADAMRKLDTFAAIHRF